MNFMFEIFPYIFLILFTLVFATVIFTTIRGIAQWNKNNHSPRLTVPAIVVAKRTHEIRRRSGTTNIRRTVTTYYATFEFESGDRMEMNLQGGEYGLLVEGDKGRLSFQGTRYLGFERT